MKKMRILLSIFLLCIGVDVAHAISYLETFTVNGITYQVYEYESGTITKYANIKRIESQAYTLEIPNQVTRPNGGLATVRSFDTDFTCDCPNLGGLLIENSTADGMIAGNFIGMPKLNNIYFYDSTSSSASTGRTWGLHSSTTFAKPITVYLSELIEPYNFAFQTYYYDYRSLVAQWKQNPKVTLIRCGDRYRDSFGVGYTPYSGATNSVVHGTITYIDNYINGDIYISSYENGWKIDRFGYPDVTTTLWCTRVTSMTFGGDITFDKGVDFSNCYALKKLVFQGDCNLSDANFPSSLGIEQIDFHGNIDLGTSLSMISSLKTVYFYGDLPDYPGIYSNASNITFYVNMDIYEIEEWKQNHSSWRDLNMLPIDPRSSYRKVTIYNQGEGSFKVHRVRDGQGAFLIINPHSTKTMEVDKGAELYVKDFSIPSTSMYRLSAFVLNNTYSWHENQQPWYEITEKTNTLKAIYRRLQYPEGTQFNIHFSMIGNGWMDFGSNEDNDWAEIDGVMQDLVGLEHDGEERDYVATYYDGTTLNINFTAAYKKPKDGIVETVTVLANGIPQASWQEYENTATDQILADYMIEINGDMDIEIVTSDNGRNISVVNGVGGTINLFKESETEAIATIGDAASYEKYIPKDKAHYAIITPNDGKEVAALFINKPLSGSDRLQLDPSQYLQENGTYRVPLDGLGEGDDTYRLSVLYADKPCYTFDIAAVGDGSIECIAFKRENGQIQAIHQVKASESTGRFKSTKAYYDEIGEDAYVEFWVSAPKEGETVKVLWNGEDVTDKFTEWEGPAEWHMRGVIDTAPNAQSVGSLASASVMAIFEKDKNYVNWKAYVVGDLSELCYADIQIAGGDVDLYTASPNFNGTLSFDKTIFPPTEELYVFVQMEPDKTFQVTFNGEDCTTMFDVFESSDNVISYAFQDHNLAQFFVDGTWIFNIMKKSHDIIEFADANVKAICVENWDTNGDGELSKAEAAAVTTLKKKNGDGTFGEPVFKENTAITSFNEFQYFTGLTNICQFAFYNCSNLTSIALPPSVTKIDGWGFCDCYALNTISLPESLTTIGSNAFNGTGLQALFIPKKVSSIASGIIGGKTDNLTSVVVDKDNSYYTSLNGFNGIFKKETENKMTLVAGCQSTTIPEGVTSILGSSFYYQRYLKAITLPSTLSSIGEMTFYCCSTLESVVSLAKTPPTLGSDAFYGIKNTCVLTVPYGTRDAYIAAGWTTDIFKGGVVEEEPASEIIEFADAEVKRICVENWDTNGDGELSKAEAAAVTTLKKKNGNGTFGDPVFKGNTNITSFEEFQFFTGLTSVEEYAFSSCRNLTSVIVPKNVETTQNSAFSGCWNLSITLPEGLTELGPNTFYGCKYMKNIRLPESLTTIARQVFYECYGLKSLFIPKNVTSINVFNSALSSTYNLISISVDPENTTYDSRKGCNAIITTATNYMVYGCQNTVIPEDVTQLYGFWGQRNLKSIVIPKSVTSITTTAFINCTNLTSVVAKGVTPPTLNTDAFKNISANCVLTVPYGKKQAYIDAGWTTDVFKGGIVEDKSQFDTNGDSNVTIADVTTLVNVILGKPIQ